MARFLDEAMPSNMPKTTLQSTPAAHATSSAENTLRSDKLYCDALNFALSKIYL